MSLEEYIRQNLKYDPEAGTLIWLTNGTGKRKAGQEAGFIKTFRGGKRYRYVTVCGRKLLAHRIAYFLVEGAWPDTIDHEDGDGTNNAWGNLRSTTCLGNHKNMRRYRNNTTGESGVILLRNGTFQVQVRNNGKYNYIGVFSSIEQAVVARDKAYAAFGYHKFHGKVQYER